MYESKTAWLEAVLEKRRSQNKITTETNQKSPEHEASDVQCSGLFVRIHIKQHKNPYEFVSFCYMIEV